MWFQKNKVKILAFVLIVATLAAAFYYGGNAPGAKGWDVTVEAPPVSTPEQNAGEPAPEQNQEPPTGAGMIIDPETGKDKYLTDPVPEGKPIPVEPQDVTIGTTA